VVKNSLFGVGHLIISTVLMAFTIPVFVRKLGSDAYGLFSLVMVAGNLTVLTGLGLNSALIRFLAQQGKSRQSDHDILVSLLILGGISIPQPFLGMVLHPFLASSLLNIPPDIYAASRWLLLCVLSANVFLLVGQTFTSMLDSQEKVYISSTLQVIYSVLYWGLVLAVLLAGGSLEHVGWAVLGAAAFWFVALTVVAVRDWGYLDTRQLRSNFLPTAKKQLSYGLQVYASGCIGFLNEPLTKILVSALIGVREVGFLDIAFKVRNQVWGLVYRLLYPLLPMFSKMTDRAHLRFVVSDVEHKIVLLVVPLSVLVVASAEPLVSLWIGENVGLIAVAMAVIVSSFLIGSSTITPFYHYLIAKGKASTTVVLQMVNASVNAILLLSTFHWFGYYSAVAAQAVAILSSFWVTCLYQRREFSKPVFGDRPQFGKIGIVAIATVAAAFGVRLFTEQ